MLCTIAGITGLFNSMQGDKNCNEFGLGMNISGEAMAVNAQILYPVKLCYGDNKIVEPKLNGSWNLAGAVKVARPPPLLSCNICLLTSYVILQK